MHRLPLSFIGLLLTALLLPGTLFAETTSSFPAPAQAVLVATVNIHNAHVTAQTGNTVNISFDLANGDGVQPGVSYATFLTRTDSSGQVLVDEQVYNETLTLGADSQVHKDITYIVPPQLSGIYDLWISSKNGDGLPLAVAFVGKVRFQPVQGGGVFIDPGSCFLAVVGDAKRVHYTVAQGVDIAPKEALEAHCVVQNTTNAPVTLTPSFVTHLYNSYGAIVSATGGEVSTVMLAPMEHKTFVFALPKAGMPQAYDTMLTITTGANVTSNTVKFHYVLRGASATILNVVWDKDTYQKGDTAAVSFLWSPSADSFFGSRLGSGTPLESPVLELSMTDEAGVSCGAPLTQPLSSSSETSLVNMQFAVTQACVHPVVSATIKDAHGVLAQGRFVTATTTQPAASNSTRTTMLVTLFLVVLCGIASVAFYLKRKGGSGMNPHVPGALIALVIIASGVLGGAPSAHANTWYSLGVPEFDVNNNPTGTYQGRTAYTVNLDKSSYLPGEQVSVTTSLSNGYCNNAEYDQSVVFNVDGSGTSFLVVNSTIVGSTLYGPFINTLSAPIVPGTHNLDFTAILTNGRYSDDGSALVNCYVAPYGGYAGPNQCVANHGFSGGMNGQTTTFALPFNVLNNPLPPPPVVTVTQSPGSAVVSGTTGTISWTATNSPTSCSLAQDGVTYATGRSAPGSDSSVIIAPTTFTVTCFNAGGQGSGSVSFTIVTPPVLASIPSIAYGNVTVTETKDSTAVGSTYITLQNAGPAGSVLHVTGITPSADFACVSNCTAILASGASVVATVRLTAPGTPGPLRETIQVNSDGGNQGVIVSANVVPVITIMPGPLNFGTIVVGTHADKMLIINNNSSTITVPAGSVTVAAPFSCVSSCAYAAIPPQSSQSVLLRYQPAAPVASDGSATLSTSLQSNSGEIMGTGAPQQFKVIEK